MKANKMSFKIAILIVTIAVRNMNVRKRKIYSLRMRKKNQEEAIYLEETFRAQSLNKSK